MKKFFRNKFFLKSYFLINVKKYSAQPTMVTNFYLKIVQFVLESPFTDTLFISFVQKQKESVMVHIKTII